MADKKMSTRSDRKMKKNEDEQAIGSINIGDDFVEVEFIKPSRTGYTYYRYDTNNPGAAQVEKMKELAENGGLVDYIEREVRKMYAKRW